MNGFLCESNSRCIFDQSFFALHWRKIWQCDYASCLLLNVCFNYHIVNQLNNYMWIERLASFLTKVQLNLGVGIIKENEIDIGYGYCGGECLWTKNSETILNLTEFCDEQLGIWISIIAFYMKCLDKSTFCCSIYGKPRLIWKSLLLMQLIYLVSPSFVMTRCTSAQENETIYLLSR